MSTFYGSHFDVLVLSRGGLQSLVNTSSGGLCISFTLSEDEAPCVFSWHTKRAKPEAVCITEKSS